MSVEHFYTEHAFYDEVWFFSLLFTRSSTVGEIVGDETYVRHIAVETREYKGGKTVFRSLHLILRQRRSPRRHRGRCAIAGLTTRYRECLRVNAISYLIAESAPDSIILSMADVVLRGGKTKGKSKPKTNREKDHLLNNPPEIMVHKDLYSSSVISIYSCSLIYCRSRA